MEMGLETMQMDEADLGMMGNSLVGALTASNGRR